MALGLSRSDGYGSIFTGSVNSYKYIGYRADIYGSDIGISTTEVSKPSGYKTAGITPESEYSGIVADYSTIPTFTPKFVIKY